MKSFCYVLPATLRRRDQPDVGHAGQVRFGDVTVDLKDRRVSKGGSRSGAATLPADGNGCGLSPVDGACLTFQCGK